MISNCNCPEKVDCGCELEFDSYETGTTSVLDVGNLVDVSSESGCEIEGYVIDWYRNGELALVSASEVGLTSEATAIHPFTGSSAIPIEGGTYVPVVRFLVIDGEKIFTTPKLCQKWCNMAITLPEIEVERLNCGSTNISGNYQWELNYYSNVPGSLPSRTIVIDLPSDQSTKYMAFYFYGANVADQIEILFNGITILTSWVVGDNLTASQYNTQPYHRDYTAHYFVVELPEYGEGDFLKIVISPSIIEEIPQTDWVFRYKCLDNSKNFDCSIFSVTLREYDITDWSFALNESACQREFKIKMVYPFPTLTGDNSWFQTYMLIGSAVWSSSTSYLTDQYAGVTLSHTIGWYAIQFYLTNYSVRAATAGNVNLKKVGNVFTFTFSDVDDYDAAYANYQAGIASSWYTTREVSDTSDYKFYRFWYWKWRSRPENCGDTTNYERSLWFHCGSSIVFSDSGGVYTCTITSLVVTNEYSSDTCNNVVTTINSYINGVNAAIGASDYEEDTLCFEWKMFGLGYGVLSEVPQIYSANSGAVSVVSYGNVGPCLPFDLMCVPSKMPMNTFRWDGFIWYFRLVVTLVKDSNEVDWPRDEETGEYIDDPCENFKVYWCLDEDGCYLPNTNDHVLILEVVDGVVEYQLAYEDLYT